MKTKILVLICALIAFAPSAAVAGVVFIPIIIPVPATVPAAQTAAYSRIHTIAVLPALGNTLHLQNNHFWGPKSKPLDISGWNLDGLAGDLLTKYLSQKFTVKKIQYDAAAIAALPNGPFENSRTKLSAILRKLPDAGVDAYVVLRPDLEYQAPGLEGLAAEEGTGLVDTLPIIWANYEIDLVDAHSFDIIAKAYSRVAYRAGETPSFANIIAPASTKLDDNLTPTPAQEETLRKFASKLITSSITETLRALQINVDLPAPGDRTLSPIPSDKKPYPAVKSIGIASIAGAQITLVHTGAMFAHDVYNLPVADWNLDDHIDKTIASHLDSRFAVKTVTIDLKLLAQVHIVDGNKKINPDFSSLPVSQDVDAYLVTFPMTFTCNTGMRDCPGLGVLHFTPMGNSTTQAFANYAIALIDARTLKLIAFASGVMPPDHKSIEVSEDLTNADWPEKPPALDPAQSARVKQALTDAIDTSVPEAMLRIGLTGMMVDTPAPPPASKVSQATAN